MSCFVSFSFKKDFSMSITILYSCGKRYFAYFIKMVVILMNRKVNLRLNMYRLISHLFTLKSHTNYFKL